MHAGCDGRAGETHQEKSRQGAPVRPDRPRRGRPEGSRRALRLLGERLPLQEGKRAGTTLERWQQLCGLRARNVGLLECALAACISRSTPLSATTAPGSRSGCSASRNTALLFVDPHRDYLRKRRAEEPGVPVQQLLREIRERGYQGGSNLLVLYINQGRPEGNRRHGTCRCVSCPAGSEHHRRKVRRKGNNKLSCD